LNSEAEQLDWVDNLAKHIKAKGASSLFFTLVEAIRPFGFLGSQVLLFAQPLLNSVMSDTSIERTSMLLENPELLSRLSATLEGDDAK
jgi:hypothetical protein